MTKVTGTSRKTVYKHQKFQLQTDVNDEFSCWIVICRHPYKYRLTKDDKTKAHEYRLENSRVSPNLMDVLWRRISRRQYEEHPKHILEMIWIE